MSRSRPSTDAETPRERVNKFLSQAIGTRSVAKEMRDHVNLATLRFRSSSRERQVSLTAGPWDDKSLSFSSGGGMSAIDSSSLDQLHQINEMGGRNKHSLPRGALKAKCLSVGPDLSGVQERKLLEVLCGDRSPLRQSWTEFQKRGGLTSLECTSTVSYSFSIKRAKTRRSPQGCCVLSSS